MEPTKQLTGWARIRSLLPFLKNRTAEISEEPEHTYFFTYKELKKATDNFKKKLGDGGYSDVYEGKLRDNRIVAVKVLKERTQKSLEQFNNEVQLLSGLQHKNLVRFYGCTKPHEELLLVYEFVANHTLYYHLHHQRKALFWPQRMRIAIEIAEGLLYLHSAESPIIHRDVKPHNILLDHNYQVKVADFGLSRLLPSDEANMSTLTPSTPGYEDPEYRVNLHYTLKSDVYSFGVVLAELITRKKAVDIYRGPGNIYLEDIAPSMIMNKELYKIVDPDIGYHSDNNVRRIIDSVAELALKCLQLTGNLRPPMMEVLRVLKEINDEMKYFPVFSDVQNGDRAQIFCFEELAKATNSFSQLIGYCNDIPTYLGKLQDGQTVAVRLLTNVNLTSLVNFCNGADELYRIRHKNIEAFYGCTNPHDGPLLLVYEYVPNNVLHHHIHIYGRDLTWSMRIQIAVETAEALIYLHSLQPLIIHNDVTTSNILLDHNFHVKVFLLPWDATCLKQGKIGYQYPEYDHTLILTDKSDVLSFGVMLLELILGKKGLELKRKLGEVYLYPAFKNILRYMNMDDIVDRGIRKSCTDDDMRMIKLVARLACQCLEPNGDNRPPMVKVLKCLKGINEGTD